MVSNLYELIVLNVNISKPLKFGILQILSELFLKYLIYFKYIYTQQVNEDLLPYIQKLSKDLCYF